MHGALQIYADSNGMDWVLAACLCISFALQNIFASSNAKQWKSTCQDLLADIENIGGLKLNRWN